jgi:hypothetical protein
LCFGKLLCFDIGFSFLNLVFYQFKQLMGAAPRWFL